jgi:thiamine biosynthesis lipoprotein
MHTFRAMNTQFSTIGLPRASQAKAESWFAFVERNLSRFQPGSELSALNRSQGRPFMASALLFQALAGAQRYYEETGGLFHPYLGKVLASLGYSDSFEKLSSGGVAHGVPDAGPAAPMPICEEAPATLNPGMMTVVLQEGYAVDLGGFAKGWSADQLSGMLRREGIRIGAIDAGGDIVLWGVPDKGWEIAVANPFKPEEDLLSLRIGRPAGIATSSSQKRRWTDEFGRERHHLIDPRRLAPADSGLVQATVIAPTLTEAEVYAKCLLLLGEEKGVPWLREKRPDYAYFAVRRDGSVLRSDALERYGSEGGDGYARAI